MAKTINTTRGEAWVKLNKIAQELNAVGDKAGAAIVAKAVLDIGAL